MIFWQSYVKVVEKLFDSLEADVSVHHVEREGFLFAGLLSTDFEGTTIPFFFFLSHYAKYEFSFRVSEDNLHFSN